jgi:hypothetical protein
MTNKSILTVCLIILLSINSFAAGTPDVCTIVSPAAGTTTYNSRPFIILQVRHPSFPINSMVVRFYQTAAGDDSYIQQDWWVDVVGNGGSPACPGSFYPCPTTAGVTTTVRFRPPNDGHYNVPAGTYWLRVYARSSDPTDRPFAGSSLNQFTIAALPSWTDNPTVSAGGTRVKSAHLTELRSRINTVRAFRGLGAYSYSYAAGTGTNIRAVDFNQTRTALDQAVNLATGSNITYVGNPAITSGSTRIKAADINEMRTAVSIP